MRVAWIPLCVVLTLAAGCRDASLTGLTDDAQEVLDRARDGAQSLSELSPDELLDGARSRAQALGELSSDEINELWGIEYRSVIVLHADLETLDEQLTELGRQRWECYHVSDEVEGKRFYFKRTKSIAVSNLTNLLRLGAIVF